MRLYIYPFAPNVVRVQVVALERSVELEVIDSSVNRAELLGLNPLGQVPVLQRPDGSILTESLTICQYIDALGGAPSLFGEGQEERLTIAMWERRAEMQLFNPGVEYGHHVHPMFARFMQQFPDYAASIRPKAQRAAEMFAQRLGQVPFLAGETFSVADITACLGYIYLRGYGAFEGQSWPSLESWSARILDRPSMAQVKQTLEWFAAPMPGTAAG